MGVLCAAVSPATSALVFDDRHATFGDRYQGSTLEVRYAFSNTGDTPVTITDTFVVDGTGRISVSPRTVAPGARGVAVVLQPLEGQLGNTAFRYALITDEPGAERYRFTLSGFVESAYDPESPTIDFGVVERSSGGAAEVELSSREVASLRVRTPVELPGGITLEALGPAGESGQGQRFRARLPPGSAPGLVAGSFVLETNVVNQPRLQVYYRANVLGDVVPSENPLQLGITRLGQVLSKEILLESRSGRAFEVERIVDTGGLLEWAVEPCSRAGDACRRIVLHMEPTVPLTLTGKLLVHLAGQADPLTLNYRGMVVSPDTVIKTLEVPR